MGVGMCRGEAFAKQSFRYIRKLLTNASPVLLQANPRINDLIGEISDRIAGVDKNGAKKHDAN